MVKKEVLSLLYENKVKEEKKSQMRDKLIKYVGSDICEAFCFVRENDDECRHLYISVLVL